MLKIVELKNLKWICPTSKVAGLRCSACRKPLGNGRVAIAWIRDGDHEQSMRLCEKCGKSVEEWEKYELASQSATEMAANDD